MNRPNVYVDGKLHIKWKQTNADQPYDAMVIVKHGSHDLFTERVRNLSVAHENTTVPFFGTPDYQAIIILVDPRWDVSPSNVPGAGSFDVWVTGCGPVRGTVTDVATLESLETACLNTPPENTIRLAEGEYVLRMQSWPLPGYPGQWGGLMLNGVTLIGAGPDRTVLYIPNDSVAAIRTHGDAEIRNLSIYTNGPFSVISGGKRLKLCAVEVEYSYAQPAVSISHIPFEGEFTTLQITDSVLLGLTFNSSAVYLETCSSASESYISCNIEDTVITGWDIGVEWDKWDNCGPITVTTDCKYISGNEFGNVLEYDFVSGSGELEHCP